jgi:CRP/FNR family transcriptional regulator
MKTGQDIWTLGEAEWRELKPYAVEKTFAKGESIWQQGDEPASFCLVRSGRVNMVITNAEGAESIVHFAVEGQSFCASAILQGKPNPCEARAAVDSVVSMVPARHFLAMVQRLPAIARHLLAQMAPQVCQGHCQAAQAACPVKDRLANLLSRLNAQFAGKDLPFTRQELANMSGTTVETTIRTLSSWQKEGVIQSRRGSLRVKDTGALEEAAAF